MRAFLAIVISIGGMLSAADARESKRSAAQPYYNARPSSDPRERSVCEGRAQNADPAGRYAGYPCWAREPFSRQP
jgi:hypothetical protein